MNEPISINSKLPLLQACLAVSATLMAADRVTQTSQPLRNAVAATDQQIDALVYELYGLTEEEIKLVEGKA